MSIPVTPKTRWADNHSATCLTTSSVSVFVSLKTRRTLLRSNVNTLLTRWVVTGSCQESRSRFVRMTPECMLTPRSYTDNSFTECDADSAYPPGIFVSGGVTSTFAQRYTGTYTQGGSTGVFTVGQTVTPQAPQSTPASSNCITYSTISNGASLDRLAVRLYTC